MCTIDCSIVFLDCSIVCHAYFLLALFIIQIHNSRPSIDDRITLSSSQFNIGDAISLAIIPGGQRRRNNQSVIKHPTTEGCMKMDSESTPDKSTDLMIKENEDSSADSRTRRKEEGEELL